MLALHYGTTESPVSANESLWRGLWSLGKPLWASEDYSTYSDSIGGKCLAKLFNRNWVDGNITATFVWDLFWASFDGLACSGQGLIWSAEPWTGKYGLPDTVWAAAHTTQFTRRGWRYLHKAAGGGGYLPGKLPGTTGGTWAALTSAGFGSNDGGGGSDLTVVLETMSNNGSACAPGGGGWQVAALPSAPISICLASAWCNAHQQKPAASFVVFRTDVAAGKRFVQLPDTALDASCCLHMELPANSLTTLSTTRGAKKGVRPGATVAPIEGADTGCGVASVPMAAPFPFPFATNFSEPDRFRTFPKYLSDVDGVFRVRDDGHLHQTMLHPSQAFGGVYPTTVLGSKEWCNVSVATVAMLPANANASSEWISVVARVGHGYLFGPLGGYELKLFAAGTWDLVVMANKTAPQKILAAGGTGTLTPKGVWRELRLSVEGTQIVAAIDGAEVAKVSNARWADGLVGVGAGFHDALYKSLAVGPVVGE